MQVIPAYNMLCVCILRNGTTCALTQYACLSELGWSWFSWRSSSHEWSKHFFLSCQISAGVLFLNRFPCWKTFTCACASPGGRRRGCCFEPCLKGAFIQFLTSQQSVLWPVGSVVPRRWRAGRLSDTNKGAAIKTKLQGLFWVHPS